MQENKIQIQTRNSCNKGGHVRYQGGGGLDPPPAEKSRFVSDKIKKIFSMP